MIRLSYKKRKFFPYIFFLFIIFLVSHLLYIVIPYLHGDNAQKIPQRIQLSSGAEYVEGEVLVKFKPGVMRPIVDSIADSNLLTLVKSYSAIARLDASEYVHLKSKVKTTQQMIRELEKLAEVEVVSPNFRLKIDDTIPNDPNFGYLWGLHNTGQTGGTAGIDVDAPAAWDLTTGSSSVIVGVIDTGIDYNHPDLIPNLWVNPGEIVDGIDNDGNGYIDDIHGINAITESGDPMDDHSHGTHCAGTIGAVGNNDEGVAGVNWNIKLIGVKFMDATGWGSDADAIECINYLIDLKTTYGQNIVAANASFGGGDYDPVFESAVNAMGSAGIIFCAAAGNEFMDNDITPHYPSSYPCPNIIAVTAVDHYGYQNFNYGATSVDLGAPGVDILSTIPGLYYPQSGDIFFDDMESGPGNWTTGGINNSWAITTNQELFENPDFPVPSPPHFWSDSPGSDYLSDTDSWLMNSSDIDLSGYIGQNLFIGFGSAMLFEAGVDHAYVEVSGDSGSTWHTLMDYSEYPIYWYIPLNCVIPDSVKSANFRFRFHLVTDFSWEFPGWLIDDVGIGTVNFYGYSYKMGTSMATPHVTGAVALMAAQFPSETVLDRINRILENVTLLPSLIDTCATEGMLNLYSALSADAVQYTLTISSNSGGTTDPVSGLYVYTSGTPVEISAIANPGYNFSHWSDDVPSGHEQDNPLTLTMTANKSITANFIAKTWTQISQDNADSLDSCNLDANSIDEVIADLGSNGLWSYDNNQSWRQLTMDDPAAVACGDIDSDGMSEVIAGFSSLGLYVYDNNIGWRIISPNTPEIIACGDLDNNGQDEIIGDFGSLGLWSFDNNTSWRALTPDNATDVTTGDKNNDGMYEVVASFGALGLWTYANASGWMNLTPDYCSVVVCGDLDNNGQDDVFGAFPGIGLFCYLNNSSWMYMTNDVPTSMATGDVKNDLKEEFVGGFPLYGMWVYEYGTGWAFLTNDTPEHIACGDFANDGKAEICGDFSSLGIWVYY
ncbi:MAG: S8 family serine peptidase [Candidatus Aminicenantes bacterium]|jgi:subtilisin family serine protease